MNTPSRLATDQPTTWCIRVRGIVQGVGFRPAVWRLARTLGLSGEVLNDGDGVAIRLYGLAAEIDDFMTQLRRDPPPLARIDTLETEGTEPGEPPASFHIVPSEGGAIRTLVSPDVATCPDCLAEVLSASDRRAGHPFANCTHCGPRLSILSGLPYDRARTSMAGFPMCPQCTDEYADPADRRFHAQPIACPECGPRLWLSDRTGQAQPCDDPIAETARRLREGQILAIKGVGGFHLVADATRGDTLETLRQRKRRPRRPLALMARDLEVIARYRTLSTAEQRALEDRAAPIVLLEYPGPGQLPEAIAPGSGALGFMLPHSPLHHLLARHFDTPLVFTSGNTSGRPQCTDNDEALTRLGAIADAFLLHDRAIINRVDDSVLHLIDGAPTPLRCARGFAPLPLPLPPGLEDAPPLLALGGELKNTFCLLREGQATLSQHIGDLEQTDTWRDWQGQLERFARLFAHRPRAIAIDGHPGYRSSAWGRDRATREGLPLITVQHHHAHLAACLAEHGVPADADPSLGIVLDGIGHGEDGSGWGGELLVGDYRDFRRIARLRPAALPGGAQAMREPWRNLAARLLSEAPGMLERTEVLADRPLETLRRMIEHGVNSPPASSGGRLFDAVAALLGLAPTHQSFEGEAAMALEQAAHAAKCGHPCHLEVHECDGLVELDPAPLWPALIEGIEQGVPVGLLARGFHEALAEAFARVAIAAAQKRRITRIALSGGVLQNRLLAEQLCEHLRAADLQVLIHRQVPANDGGLALGQACIAAARLREQQR